MQLEAFVATLAMTACGVQYSMLRVRVADTVRCCATHRTAAGWLQPSGVLRFACRMARSHGHPSSSAKLSGPGSRQQSFDMRSKDGRMDFEEDQIPVPRRIRKTFEDTFAVGSGPKFRL